MFSVKAVLASVMISAATVAAVPALAAVVGVSAQHGSVFGDTSGANQWYVTANYTKGGKNRNVHAGAFRLNATDLSGTKSFIAFCLSPFEWLHLPLEYVTDASKSLLTPTMITRLSALANGAWASIADADTAGAFQLAAWEIVSEDDPATALNLDNGAFVLNSTSSAVAKDTAQAWLGNVWTGAFKSAPSGISILSADWTQDLLTYNPPAPVPLPGSLGFLAVGLAALAAKSRARRT